MISPRGWPSSAAEPWLAAALQLGPQRASGPVEISERAPDEDEWREFNLDPIAPDEIVAAAQKKHLAAYVEWRRQFVDK